MTELLERPLSLPCGLILKNRLIKTATAEGLADTDGRPTAPLLRLYRQWSMSGTAAIITGNIHVDRNHREQWRSLVIESHSQTGRFQRLTHTVQQHGCALFAQLNHGGPQTPNDIHHHPFAPSEYAPPWYFLDYNPSQAMNENDIEDVIDRFVSAARFCEASGFSGVQIHAAHGYLLSAFLSPVTNQRTDQWGLRAKPSKTTSTHLEQHQSPDKLDLCCRHQTQLPGFHQRRNLPKRLRPNRFSAL